jgi:hypothetical protein
MRQFRQGHPQGDVPTNRQNGKSAFSTSLRNLPNIESKQIQTLFLVVRRLILFTLSIHVNFVFQGFVVFKFAHKM